jgi:6,7-dimethyl-8-ribityllumazine synthase
MTGLGLVIARFYEELAAAIETEARERVRASDAEHVETVSVPGVYDAPLAADRLAQSPDVDAVAVLGVVVTGDTDHDRVVTRAAARKLADVSLNRDTPVTFGVSGPGMSADEARERVEYCADAVDAAVDLATGLPAATRQ